MRLLVAAAALIGVLTATIVVLVRGNTVTLERDVVDRQGPPASAQVAPRWSHTADGGEQSARYKELGNELVVRCLGSSLELVLYLDLPFVHEDLRGRPSANMALIIDDTDVHWFQGRLIADDTTLSIGVANRTANDFAHFIVGATRTFSTSLQVEPPGPGSLQYSLFQYPIEGAAAAIKDAYAGCGIPF